MRRQFSWVVGLLVAGCTASASGGQNALSMMENLDLLTAALEKPVAVIQGKMPAFTLALTPELGAGELGEVRITSAGEGRYGLVVKSPLLNFELVRDAETTRLVVPAKKVAFVGTGPLMAESEMEPARLLESTVSGWPQAHAVLGVLRAADAGAVALLLQQLLQLERVVVAGEEKAGPVFRTKKGVGGGILTIALTPDGKMLRNFGWHRNGASVEVGISILEEARMPKADLEGLKVVAVPRAELEMAFARGLSRALGALYYAQNGPKPTSKDEREGSGHLVVENGQRVCLLQGAPYDLGFQHGKLLGGEALRVAESVLYVAGLAYSLDKGEWFLDTIRGAYKRLEPNISKDYLDEMRGLAEGSGIPLETVQLANVFPALFHCSGFALFGKATAGGKLYHGRVLDYMIELGLQRDAVVFVVNKTQAIPFANAGYAGFIGCVSGMNTSRLAIGEMGGGGEGLWDGTPMPLLIRSALERAGTLDDACRIFREAKRTCEYYYLVSDGSIPSAVGIHATPDRFDLVKPGEARGEGAVPIEDALLMSAGDRYKALVERVKESYGRIDAPGARELMKRPVAMDSNLHDVLFVPQDLVFEVANAYRRTPACDRPYATYSLKALLTELAKPPEEEKEKEKQKKRRDPGTDRGIF